MSERLEMKQKLSLISTLHYVRLGYRGLLFLCMLIVWILNPFYHDKSFEQIIDHFSVLTLIIWCVFAVEMIVRLFPSPTESMGCQKQFAKEYREVKGSIPNRKKNNKGIWLVVISWVLLNGIIIGLNKLGLYSEGVLLLVAMFYSVCDMICILFFCPFQTFMMKNRCCTTCRIYNWDFLMMVTPLIFIQSLYTRSLVILALCIFIRWELTAYFAPYRFSDECNESLHCVNCKEKLCSHKKQLKYFWKKELSKIPYEDIKKYFNRN